VTTTAATRERWREVRKAEPCPACGKPDFCAWTPDGKCSSVNEVQARPSECTLFKLADGGALFAFDDRTARPKATKPSGPKPVANHIRP